MHSNCLVYLCNTYNTLHDSLGPTLYILLYFSIIFFMVANMQKRRKQADVF